MMGSTFRKEFNKACKATRLTKASIARQLGITPECLTSRFLYKEVGIKLQRRISNIFLGHGYDLEKELSKYKIKERLSTWDIETLAKAEEIRSLLLSAQLRK